MTTFVYIDDKKQQAHKFFENLRWNVEEKL